MSRWKALGGNTGLLATDGEWGSTCKPRLRRQLDAHLSHHPPPCCTLPSSTGLDHVCFPSNTFRNSPFPWLSLAKYSTSCQIRLWLKTWALESCCLASNLSFTTGCLWPGVRHLIFQSNANLMRLGYRWKLKVHIFYNGFAILPQILWLPLFERGLWASFTSL